HEPSSPPRPRAADQSQQPARSVVQTRRVRWFQTEKAKPDIPSVTRQRRYRAPSLHSGCGTSPGHSFSWGQIRGGWRTGKVTAVTGLRFPSGDSKYMKKQQKDAPAMTGRRLGDAPGSLRRQSPLLREELDHLAIENRNVRRLPAAHPVSIPYEFFILPTRACVADVVLNGVIAGHRAVADTTS